MSLATLYAGPYNGFQVNWSGGDIIDMAPPRPVFDFSVQAVDPIRIEKCTYRRSINTPDIFVYQP